MEERKVASRIFGVPATGESRIEISYVPASSRARGASTIARLYDAGTLLTSVDAPHGGTCRGKACWTAKPTKLVYRNADRSATGTQSVSLKQGLTDGSAAITVKAKGSKIAMPDLGALTGPIVVQLQRSGGAPCFGATYSAPFLRNDGVNFRDRAD